MSKKGKYFTRIFKHYMIEALSYADGHVDKDIYTELDEACADLLEALNPKATVTKDEEPKGPFAVVRTYIERHSYCILHKNTNRVVGYWIRKGNADRVCNWLNERYER